MTDADRTIADASARARARGGIIAERGRRNALLFAGLED